MLQNNARILLLVLGIEGCSQSNVPYDAAMSTAVMCTNMPDVNQLDFLGTTYAGTGPDYVRHSIFAFKDPESYTRLIASIETNLCDTIVFDSCGCWTHQNALYRFTASEAQKAKHFFMDAELSTAYHLLIIREVHW